MTASNFHASLAFVWQPTNDNPGDGFHVSPNDHGGPTNAGITDATWTSCVATGLVTGMLKNASANQLSSILQTRYWGDVCNTLPSGLDLMMFNGTMMSGYYRSLVQHALGFIGADVDGAIGPLSMLALGAVDPKTFINALTGSHYLYLKSLSNWGTFGAGWTQRLIGARNAAFDLVIKGNPK